MQEQKKTKKKKRKKREIYESERYTAIILFNTLATQF